MTEQKHQKEVLAEATIAMHGQLGRLQGNLRSFVHDELGKMHADVGRQISDVDRKVAALEANVDEKLTSLQQTVQESLARFERIIEGKR